MSVPMDLSVSTTITLDERFFGAADNEKIDAFRDKVEYLKGVSETSLVDNELTITFSDTLPHVARKALSRFIKRDPL